MTVHSDVSGNKTRWSSRVLRANPTTVLALMVLAVLGGMWLWTFDLATRRPMPQLAFEHVGPTWSCLSGYDAHGRCLLSSLAGGVHSFLGAGLLAMGVTVLGGMLLGVLAGYDRLPVRGAVRALLSMLEGLPRLAIFILVFSLSDHSPLVLGLAVGTLGIPALSGEIRERFERLQGSSFIQASRSHGLGEGRIVGLHLLWKACQERIFRQGVLTFGTLLVVESSLSFALQVNSSPTEQSWGHLLYQSTSGLYNLVSELMESSGLGWRALLGGLVPFLWSAGLLLAVQWATWHLGDVAASAREVER